jgi:uncharacterized protein DUF4339
MAYGTEDRESLPTAAGQVAAGQAERLSVYGDEDEVVTQVIDAEIAEPKWIVQVTPLDRRMMATAELVSEAMRGALVRPDTLVWRGGMDDWLPLEAVDALAAVRRQLPTLSPRARSGKAAGVVARVVAGVGQGPALGGHGLSNGLLASLAVVLSTAALTISALAVCGVFDARPAAPEPGTSASASSR